LTSCLQCGKCLNLKHCMGWKHRFWRRTIIEKQTWQTSAGNYDLKTWKKRLPDLKRLALKGNTTTWSLRDWFKPTILRLNCAGRRSRICWRSKVMKWTAQGKRSGRRHPEVCQKYYSQIENLLFDSGLIEKTSLESKYKTKEEKLEKHGFCTLASNERAKHSGSGKIKARIRSNCLPNQGTIMDWYKASRSGGWKLDTKKQSDHVLESFWSNDRLFN